MFYLTQALGEVSLTKNGQLLEKTTWIVSPTSWIDGAGTLSTKRNYDLEFKLDELPTSREVEWNFNVDDTGMPRETLGFNMVIGLDFLYELGLVIDCEEKVVEWQDLKFLRPPQFLWR